jgi:hypothetical protein
MGIPLVALMGRQPQINDYATNIAQAQQIQGMKNQNALAPGQLQGQQNELQMQQMQMEAQKRQIETQKALDDAYKNSVIPDENGQPKIDTNKLSEALRMSGHGSAIPGILEGVTKYQTSLVDMKSKMQKLQEDQSDLFGHAAYAIQQANYDPRVAHRLLDPLGDSPQIQQMRQLIDSNPQQFKQLVDSARAASPIQQKMENERKVAEIRAAGTVKEGELPLGEKVPQLNQGLARRFQVLNPGAALPAEYTLPANATQKDFDRIDKILTQTEQAQGVKAQQEFAHGVQLQNLQLSKQAHADAQAQHAAKPVLAYDSSNQAHLLPEGDAKAAGYTGITEATPKQIDDAKTHTVVLNTMQTKLNDVMASREALNQGPEQRAIISKVLSHSEPGVINDAIRNLALKAATPQTKEYIQSVLQLKETSLGLPKEITGGSRTSETQSSALFQTLPSGSSADANYALGQGKKFQADIDRLRERVPNIRGVNPTEAHPDLTGKKGAAPNVIYARDPQGKLHQAPAGTALPTGWKQEQKP